MKFKRSAPFYQSGKAKSSEFFHTGVEDAAVRPKVLRMQEASAGVEDVRDPKALKVCTL